MSDLALQVCYSVFFEAVNKLWETDETAFDRDLLCCLLELIRWCKE